jgi:hypothetical protein
MSLSTMLVDNDSITACIADHNSRDRNDLKQEEEQQSDEEEDEEVTASKSEHIVVAPIDAMESSAAEKEVVT